MTEIIGYIAATLTTSAFAPQAYKIYKTNQTKDLSLLLFLLMTTGVFVWLIYGILLSSLPMIIANAITLMLSGYILFVKITNLKEEKENHRRNNNHG